MRFNEIWSIEPTVRLGKLDEQSLLHGRVGVFAGMPRVQPYRPFPGTDNNALNPRVISPIADNRVSIQVNQNWIINPQDLYRDEIENPLDSITVINRRDRFQPEGYIEREVATFNRLTPGIENYAAMIEQVQRPLAVVFGGRNWIPEEPLGVWRRYCEYYQRDPGNPVDEQVEWIACRLTSALLGVLQHEDPSLAAEAARRISAQSADPRDARDTLSHLISAVHSIPPGRVQYIPLFGRSVMGAMNEMDGMERPFPGPSVRPGPPTQPTVQPVSLPPAFTPSRGVIIHLVQPGRRPLNLE